MPASGSRPLTERPLIDRPRLVERLAQRFERRLTIVVGGGGAGKTTLLGQAVSEAGDRLDVWHTCVPSDREPDRLLVALDAATADALGTPRSPDGPKESVTGICEAVLSRSPQQVCLVLDDSHKLDRFDLIDELLQELPANGHVLLAGRRRPAIDTARLDAAGRLVEITQDDLLMTRNELIAFANLRGIDVALLEETEGWPAFVELASTGSEARSRRYLEEEALRGLSPERRHALGVFAFVGGGDDEIARATTGMSLDDLVADLPLVRWEAGEARLHDLWGELLADELDDDARLTAARGAAARHRRQGRFDRAVDLARTVADWEDLMDTLGAAAIKSVDGGLQADRLRRWRASLPAELDHHPVTSLLDGLIERERDPTSPRAWALLDHAAEAFETDDHRELALAALLQLGYVARICGDTTRLAVAMDRLTVLAERHPPARPFLAFGQAWTALATARPDLQLAAMEAVADDNLPFVWRVTRDHLIAHALMSMGRAAEGLGRVPRDVETLPVAIPGALCTESQCLWFGGHPEEALRRRPGDLSAHYGARDLFIAGGWNAMMLGYAGDVAGCRRALDVAIAHAGETPGALVAGQKAALDVVVRIAEGDEDRAAADLAAIIDLVPLGGGVGEQMLRNNVAPAYVLVPSTREFWDRFDFGPSQREALSVVRAFTAWRDGERGPIERLAWPEPGLVAAHLPCRWGIEMALAGLAVGRADGRRLAAWLCEHWGEPARAALHSWLDDDTLGTVAREVLAQTPTPPAQRVAVKVLGQTTVTVDGFPSDDPNLRRERVRALLVALILKPTTTRDQLAGMLWPDQPAEKAAKNLRTTLGYLHGLLEPRRSAGDAPWFVRVDGHQVRLHHDLDVDLRRFTGLLDRAEAAEREGRPNTALPLLLGAVTLWHGDLAIDLDLEWLDLERIHLRSRFVRASCRAAELLVATREPERAIEVVRPALDVDQWNAPSYLALAAAYDALGDHTSARAVLERGAAVIGGPIGSHGRTAPVA